MTEKAIWGIHMRRTHGLAPIEKSYVAIGWREMGDLSLIKRSRDAFKAAYERSYPDAGPGTVRTSAGVPFRFLVEMKPGDLVLFPSKPDRMVNLPLRRNPNAHSRAMKVMGLITFCLWFQGFKRLVGQGLPHVSSFRMTLQ
jgi:restriction system protein